MNDATKDFRKKLFDLLDEHKVEVEVTDDGRMEFFSYTQLGRDGYAARATIDFRLDEYFPGQERVESVDI